MNEPNPRGINCHFADQRVELQGKSNSELSNEAGLDGLDSATASICQAYPGKKKMHDSRGETGDLKPKINKFAGYSYYFSVNYQSCYSCKLLVVIAFKFVSQGTRHRETILSLMIKNTGLNPLALYATALRYLDFHSI